MRIPVPVDDCTHRWDWFYGSDLIKHVVCVLCGWGDCCEVHRRTQA